MFVLGERKFFLHINWKQVSVLGFGFWYDELISEVDLFSHLCGCIL